MADAARFRHRTNPAHLRRSGHGSQRAEAAESWSPVYQAGVSRPYRWKIQTPNTKDQGSPKRQTSNSKETRKANRRDLEFETWRLVLHWSLDVGGLGALLRLGAS